MLQTLYHWLHTGGRAEETISVLEDHMTANEQQEVGKQNGQSTRSAVYT